jgi:hypothetical protein
VVPSPPISSRELTSPSHTGPEKHEETRGKIKTKSTHHFHPSPKYSLVIFTHQDIPSYAIYTFLLFFRVIILTRNISDPYYVVNLRPVFVEFSASKKSFKPISGKPAARGVPPNSSSR